MNKSQDLDWSFLEKGEEEEVEKKQDWKEKIRLIRKFARDKKIIGYNPRDLNIDGVAPVLSYVCPGCDHYVRGMPTVLEDGSHYCRLCGEYLGGKYIDRP